jgi:type IVB pilus formation R64 PilN family outer membrane protein
MKKTILATCILTQLAACAGPSTRRTEEAYGASDQRVGTVKLAEKNMQQDGNSATTAVHGIWLGGKSVPFKNDLALPGIFHARKDFLFPKEKMTIVQVSERFKQVTGIPVRISPDVFSGAASAPASAQGGQNALPSLPQLPGGMMNMPQPKAMTASDPSGLSGIVLNSTTTPAAMLDQICNGLGLSWEYKDGGAVIQRYVTRSFALKVTPGTSTFSFASGKTASSSAQSATGGSGNIATGFSSESSVKNTGTMSPMESVVEAIKVVLTPAGKVVASAATGSIVVVDTVDGVERAGKIVDRENEILTRSARFKIEVLSLTEEDNADVGVDLNAVFSNLNKFGATLVSPSSLVSSTAGALGLNVVTATGGSVGRYDGTSAVVKALAQYGKVSTVYNVDLMTRNRNLTPLAIQTQTVYLAQTTPGTTSGSGSAPGAPGLTPGTATTGFNLTLQPNIMDSNEMAVQFQVGLIDLIDIKTLTSGTGINQQSIEAPQTGGFEFKQDVFLRTGQTMVLSGYERTNAQYTDRRLGEKVPMLAGGSFSGKSKKERLYILITPTVVGSAK